MAPEHFINALVSRGIVGGVNLCTGVEQGLDDGNVVDLGLVYGRPNCLTQGSNITDGPTS